MQSNGENDEVRLLDFFDQKGTLSTLQFGGRVKRTTNDHFLFLEATVRNAQANKEHVVSIFFHMKRNLESRHPDGRTRSRNRRNTVQSHTKLPQTKII